MTEQERHRRYYLKHRDKILARTQAYKKANRELVRERAQAYRQTHPDLVRQQSRLSYQRHKHRYRDRQKAERRRNREKYRAYHRDYYKRNREALLAKTRRNQLVRKYGLTPERRDAMLSRQGGRCAICGISIIGKRKSHVDHDHETGEVRGLLCGNCNRGLGYFGDSVGTLRAAAAYLG